MSNIDFRQALPLTPAADRQARADMLRQRAAAVTLLRETDWYVLRLAETGEAIPAEIRSQRSTARVTLSQSPPDTPGAAPSSIPDRLAAP